MSHACCARRPREIALPKRHLCNNSALLVGASVKTPGIKLVIACAAQGRARRNDCFFTDAVKRLEAVESFGMSLLLHAGGRSFADGWPAQALHQLQLTHACGRFYLTHHGNHDSRYHTYYSHNHHHTFLHHHPQRSGSNTNTGAIQRLLPRRAFASIPFVSRHSQHRLYSDLKMATETNWPAAKVRQTFLEYFEQRGHTVGAYSDLNLEHTCLRYERIPVPQYFNIDPCHSLCKLALLQPARRHANYYPSFQSPRALSSLTMTPPCSSPTRA